MLLSVLCILGIAKRLPEVELIPNLILCLSMWKSKVPTHNGKVKRHQYSGPSVNNLAIFLRYRPIQMLYSHFSMTRAEFSDANLHIFLILMPFLIRFFFGYWLFYLGSRLSVLITSMKINRIVTFFFKKSEKNIATTVFFNLLTHISSSTITFSLHYSHDNHALFLPYPLVSRIRLSRLRMCFDDLCFY